MNTRRIYPYIDDEIFIKEVKAVLDGVDKSLNEIDGKLFKNILDPFSAIFDAYSQNISYEEWMGQEKYRQLQKTLQNSIGYFHQNIIGAIGDWKNTGHGGGYDVENSKIKAFAEIKNKHNTFNSSSAAETYNKMVRFLDSKKGHTAYVVIIIPKKVTRYSKPFAPSGYTERKDLIEIDGASFYEIVTGNKNGLRLLFEAIPVAIKIIKKLTGKQADSQIDKFSNLFVKAFGN